MGAGAGAPARRRAAAVAGHRGDTATIQAALHDPDPGTRAIAVAAASRAGSLTVAAAVAALADPDPAVRRRAAEVCASAAGLGADVVPALVSLLDDHDASVAEVAAWALGEVSERGELPAGTVDRICAAATGHDDPLVREAAVAALGALGDAAGLPAILAATRDRPAVRRRAVLALAPFDGPDVTEALERAREDRDWQVRDAADLLLRDD